MRKIFDGLQIEREQTVSLVFEGVEEKNAHRNREEGCSGRGK